MMKRGARDRLRRMATASSDIEAEYLQLTGPLAQAVALAGLAPAPSDQQRIDVNRARAAQLERERRELLFSVAASQRRFRDLLAWFDLEPALDAATSRLTVEWSPRATRYRNRVTVRAMFTPEADLRSLCVSVDSVLLEAPLDAAAMHDLMASALGSMADPCDQAARTIARELRLMGPAALVATDAEDLSLSLCRDVGTSRVTCRIERRASKAGAARSVAPR